MNKSAWLRRFLLVAGLGLLAVYAGIRMDGVLHSRARLKAFDQQRTQPKPRHRLPDPSAVDFSRWSPGRVRGYQASLQASMTPPLAVLRIPSIALEVPVLPGTDEIALNRGVGWITGTPLPGTAGNVGIAGHRDGFFRGLKDIQVGDLLELETLEARDEYVVDAIEIVAPEDSEVLRPRATPSLTLVTCYPFYFVGNAPQRYIVHASVVEAEPQPGDRSGSASPARRISTQEKRQ